MSSKVDWFAALQECMAALPGARWEPGPLSTGFTNGFNLEWSGFTVSVTADERPTSVWWEVAIGRDVEPGETASASGFGRSLTEALDEFVKSCADQSPGREDARNELAHAEKRMLLLEQVAKGVA